MSGYSGTPLWKKLGYQSGVIAYVRGTPADYGKLLGIPKEIEVVWVARLNQRVSLVHHFTRSKLELRKALANYRRRVRSNAMVWISWPKKTSGIKTDVTEDVIRAIALPLGFVDVKVCAVDEIWSGLKLMIRKDER